MLKLAVRLHGQNIQVLELSDPATIYWAGRNDNCQVPLKAENGISRQHFKIYFKDGMWNLEVVSRFNEVKVGEVSSRELLLKEGLAFSLPPYEFSVESQHTMAVQESLSHAVGSDVNRGMVAPFGEEVGDRTVTRALGKNAQYLLIYRNPDTKEDKLYILTKDTYLVGRDTGCDIVLDDARVSRRQFKIKNKGGRFFLFDNLGVNGTYVNKTKLASKEPVGLNSGDQIGVLNHRFSFEIRDPDFESKMQKVQYLALVEPVPPPEIQGYQQLAAPGAEGMPVALSPDMFGALQPRMNSGLPSEMIFQTPPVLEGGAAVPSSVGNVKELNFWGFRIPLTKQNKIRLVLGTVVFIALIIAFSDDSSNDFNANMDVAARPADPFSKLTPKEQELVKAEYASAKDLYSQGNYQLAKDRLAIVHTKVPYYLDSKKLAEYIEIGIKSMQERELEERRKREEAETQEQIQNIVAYCRQQIKPASTSAEIEDCLRLAIQINPEHELILKIREDVGRMEDERKNREAQEATRKAQIEQYRTMYKQAYDVGEKKPLEGIAEFKKFLEYSMPDPDKLQDKAKKDIKRLEKKIKSKVSAAISSVRSLVETGKHREAIIALEKASEVAPNDDTLREEIERLTEELRKKMQILYQEAILEENIGNIDTAKDRWRKILDQDIPNGEYFGKAKTKLQKYGGA